MTPVPLPPRRALSIAAAVLIAIALTVGAFFLGNARGETLGRREGRAELRREQLERAREENAKALGIARSHTESVKREVAAATAAGDTARRAERAVRAKTTIVNDSTLRTAEGIELPALPAVVGIIGEERAAADRRASADSTTIATLRRNVAAVERERDLERAGRLLAEEQLATERITAAAEARRSYRRGVVTGVVGTLGTLAAAAILIF